MRERIEIRINLWYVAFGVAYGVVFLALVFR
jgi:hypothetical protein